MPDALRNFIPQYVAEELAKPASFDLPRPTPEGSVVAHARALPGYGVREGYSPWNGTATVTLKPYRNKEGRMNYDDADDAKKILAEAVLKSNPFSASGTSGLGIGSILSSPLSYGPSQANSTCQGLFIIRGVPGSGKTTLAKLLARMFTGPDGGAAYFSEDDYWTDLDGNYKYDASTTEEAISEMLRRALEAIHRPAKAVILHTACGDFSHCGWRRLFDSARRRGVHIFPIILQRERTNPASIHDVSESEMLRHVLSINSDPLISLPFTERDPITHEPR